MRNVPILPNCVQTYSNDATCINDISLVVEINDFESDAYFDTESKPEKGNDRGKKIIDAKPNAIISTTNIQKEELEDS